jgi:hypothetical protein
MWSFATQPGLATAVLDFTNDLSLLGVGLLGLVALSMGSLAGRSHRPLNRDHCPHRLSGHLCYAST